jgi:hypothetical protein
MIGIGIYASVYNVILCLLLFNFSPYLVADCTHIQVFQVVFVVPNIQHFAVLLVGVRLALCVGTRQVVHTWQGRVQFRIRIDNMTKRLLSGFQMGHQYTSTFLRNTVVFMPTVPAVVGQLVRVVVTDTDVVHVVALCTEFHGIGSWMEVVG